MKSSAAIRLVYSADDVVRGLELHKVVPSPQIDTSKETAKKKDKTTAGLPAEWNVRCKDGERTNHLTVLAGKLIQRGHRFDVVVALAHGWNRQNDPPLPDHKVESTCEGIWNTHQRNHPADEGDAADPERPLFDIGSARTSDLLRQNPPPRRWLLEKCLPYGKVGAIVAPGGTGKSQLLIQLGVSVATGLPFLGHWKVAEPGGVLILAAEDDMEELHRRLHKTIGEVSACYKDDVGLFNRVERNLYVRSMVAEDNLMTRAVGRGQEVQTTNYVSRLVLTAKQIPDLKLIIIDPASRFRGGDENSAQDTTRFVEALERAREQTSATVLVAHHTNKWSSKGDEQDQTASRGSSAFSDGVRWQMNLLPLNKKAAKARGIPERIRRQYLDAEIVKNNYGPPTEPVLLRRADGGFLEVVTIEQAGAARDEEILRAVRELLREDWVDGVGHTRNSFEETHGGESGPLKIGKNALRSMLGKWVKDGKLTLNSKKQLLPDGPIASDPKGSSDKTLGKLDS